MNIYNPVTYMCFIFTIMLMIGIYVDYCSIKGIKSKIWSSLQKDISYFLNVKAVMKARIFVKIMFVSLLLSMAYEYAVYKVILLNQFSWIPLTIFFVGMTYDAIISYKNDCREKWIKTYKHIVTLTLILVWCLWIYFFEI